MTKHFYACVCGAEFPCVINILPLPGGLGRVKVREVDRASLLGLFESSLSGQSESEQQAILQSMMEAGDALLAWRAEQRIN